MAKKIEIEIGADVSKLQSELQLAENQLKQFQSQLRKASNVDDVSNLQKKIASLKSTIEVQNASLNNLLKTTGKFTAGNNQATQSLVNLGRVAQDAPFGFIGIANNINPLLESFQRLKAESGSTGTALKALGSSLLGAGGLGLAVSVITSALTFFSLSNRGAATEVEKTKVKVDEAAEAVKKYDQAVTAASSAIIGQQQKLVDLNRLLKDTSNSYNDLTKSVTNQAIAQFFANEKQGVVQKLIEARIKEAREALRKSAPFLDVKEFSPDLISKDKLKQAQAQLKAELVIINNTIKELGLENIFGKIFDPEKAIKKTKEDLDKLNRSVLDIKRNVTEEFLQLLYGNRNDGVRRSNIQPIGIPIKILLPKQLIEQKQIEELTKQLQDLFSTVISTVGESIAGLITGKNSLGGAFKSVLSIFGDFLIKLGKAAVLTSKLYLAIKAASKNPISGIVAGLAAIVAGNILKNLPLPQFATGTRNAPGGLSLVGDRGPELMNVPRGAQIIPAAQTANMLGGLQAIEVYGMVRGSDIYFSNKRFGGTLSRNT